MKKLFGVSLLTILLISLTTVSYASVIREYQTNYGMMTLTFNGSDVNGSYTYQGGQISGTLEGNTMRCTWKQNNGSGNCIATFSNDFNRIDLQWNYAGQSGWKGNWGGNLVRQRNTLESADSNSFATVRQYKTNYGLMTITFSGSTVNGSYDYQGGKISGTLEGNTMRCTWKQNNGSGNCIATFSNDFNRIDLQWNYTGETGWKGDWAGNLVRQWSKPMSAGYDSPTTIRKYQTNYGVMTLTFRGAIINGSYTYQGGQISGTLEGNTMRCTWKQNNGSGNCIATFSNDFNRIDLQWNYAGQSGWKGNWGGNLMR